MRPSSERIIAVLATLIPLLTIIGCASTPDPDPPDIGGSVDATNARLQSLDAFETSIRNDLERLEMLGEDLENVSERVAQAELPLSLLRLVAINCLNSEYDGGASDTGVLPGTPLTCEPAHVERLVEALDTASTSARDSAHQLLYIVDQTRHVRGILRRRLTRLADAANDHIDFIADERAMLRQLEADLEQQKNLYSSSGWQEATDVITEQRERLDTLSQRIDELADDYRHWSPHIDDVVSEMYFELSYLRAPM